MQMSCSYLQSASKSSPAAPRIQERSHSYVTDIGGCGATPRHSFEGREQTRGRESAAQAKLQAKPKKKEADQSTAGPNQEQIVYAQ